MGMRKRPSIAPSPLELGRRDLLSAVLASPYLLGAAPAFAASGLRARSPMLLPAQTTWSPPPPQAAVSEGFAELPGVHLSYWDTGGRGEPLVLLHPVTGTSAIWAYQQPVFAKAGYRVIAYSRRGHGLSEAGSKDDAGTGAGDLQALVDHLGLQRFHLLGSAAGGFILPDYAISHPDRLISMLMVNSQGGIRDPSYQKVTADLAPEGFAKLPAAFRELGPSYRAANPAGTAQWSEMEKAATPNGRVGQRMQNDLNWRAVEGITTPTLLMTGSADLYMPPTRLLGFAAHLPRAEIKVLSEAGHSGYWEQPLAFNRAVLDFLGRHSRRKA